MFEQLKRKLTITYVAAFSVILLLVAFAGVALSGWTVLSRERTDLINLLLHEGDEYVESRELPVSDKEVATGSMLAYMLSENGATLIDQVQGSPAAGELLAKRAEWPRADGETALLRFTTAAGAYKVYLACGNQIVEGQKVLGRLYMFEDMTGYYEAAVDLLLRLLAFCVVLLLVAALGGYYIAAKSIKPIETMFKRQREFVADASHELRTPLTVLGIAAEGLQNDEDSTLSEFAKDTLATVRLETARMSKLVNDLLQLARGDAQSINLQMQQIDLAAVAQKAYNMMLPLAKKKNLQLCLNVANPVVLWADESKLEQLLIILLDNAIKYSEKGMITLTVRTQGGDGVLEVADEGVGLEEHELTDVFERFYRADKARTRQEGGFGLGLSIARLIAEQHHGTISAAARKPCGTLFTVKIPL